MRSLVRPRRALRSLARAPDVSNGSDIGGGGGTGGGGGAFFLRPISSSYGFVGVVWVINKLASSKVSFALHLEPSTALSKQPNLLAQGQARQHRVSNRPWATELSTHYRLFLVFMGLDPVPPPAVVPVVGPLDC